MKRSLSLLPSLLFLVLFTIGFNPNLHSQTTSKFNIDDYYWLVGDWIGDGFGGVSEESWAPAVDGTMMGMYRHHKDGEVVFYEFLLLDETGLKLKHFNPDITGWEEKEDFITFEMIRFSENMLEMRGLVFERISDSEIVIRLKMKNSAGEVGTEVFTMKRK